MPPPPGAENPRRSIRATKSAGGNSRDVSDADAVANRGDGILPQGENSENDTNKAKFDESLIVIQVKRRKRLASDPA